MIIPGNNLDNRDSRHNWINNGSVLKIDLAECDGGTTVPLVSGLIVDLRVTMATLEILCVTG